MSMTDETQITNILYRYAMLIDAGQLAEAGALFSRARIKVRPGAGNDGDDGTIDHRQLLKMWQDMIILYDDGTPKTKHIVTNPLIEIGPDGRSARVRSCYTVIQATQALPLQTIVAGRYDDRMEKSEDGWHIVHRDYSLVDLVGDLSSHLHNTDLTR